MHIPAALVPGQVQNLRSTLDTNTPSLTLSWDKPNNMITDGDLVSYHIRFKPTGSGWEGNYCEKKINAPATSIVLTRKSGLKPMTKYDFGIRAQSSRHEGKWTKISKYICKFMSLIATTLTIQEGVGYIHLKSLRH